MTTALWLLLLLFAPQQPTPNVSGVVLDGSTGRPIINAQVSLVPAEGQPLLGPKLPVSVTDAQGRFSFETKWTGGVRLVPEKNGYYAARVWVKLSADKPATNLELIMDRAGVVSGRVVDANDQPALNAVVSLTQPGYNKDGKPTLRGILRGDGRLNDKGEFRMLDIPAGEYYVEVTPFHERGIFGDGMSRYYPGLTPDESKAVPVRVRGAEELRLGTLQLLPEGKSVELKVRVTTPEKTGNLRVSVGDTEVSFPLEMDSTERVFRIVPGRYDLQVSSPSYYAKSSFDVTTADVVQDVVLKPAAHVTAKILPALPPRANCSVNGSIGRSCLDTYVPPGKHQLVFTNLPDGVYLESAKAGQSDILADGLNVTGDVELEIVLGESGGILSGTARKLSGEPLRNGAIVLIPDAPYRETIHRYHNVETDLDGRFQIRGIAPGSYKLFGWGELKGPAYRNAEFMKEFEDRGKSIRVEKGSKATVEITAF